MGWEMKDQRIRLITEHNNLPRLCAPFVARRFGMQNEGKRYYVSQANCLCEVRWYEVVEPGDTPLDVRIKWDHYRKVIEAREALNKAQRLYRDLV